MAVYELSRVDIGVDTRTNLEHIQVVGVLSQKIFRVRLNMVEKNVHHSNLLLLICNNHLCWLSQTVYLIYLHYDTSIAVGEIRTFDSYIAFHYAIMLYYRYTGNVTYRQGESK